MSLMMMIIFISTSSSLSNSRSTEAQDQKKGLIRKERAKKLRGKPSATHKKESKYHFCQHCIWLFSLIWLSGFPLKYILLSLDKFARGMYIVNRFSIAYFRTRTLFVTIESSKILEEAWVDHIKYFRLVPIKNGINLCTNLSICQIIKI